MSNLRAFFLILGVIILVLDVFLLANGIIPGFLTFIPVALIGASVYYTLAERRQPSKKAQQQREAALALARAGWREVKVLPGECEIKSSTYLKGVGLATDEANESYGATSEAGAIWQAAKYDDGCGPGVEAVSQSVLVVTKIAFGEKRTFVSHLIPKDQTTLLFLLHSSAEFDIYIHPTDPTQYFFDIFLD